MDVSIISLKSHHSLCLSSLITMAMYLLPSYRFDWVLAYSCGCLVSTCLSPATDTASL